MTHKATQVKKLKKRYYYEKRIIVTCLLLLAFCSFSSIKAAETKYIRYLSWDGTQILGKASTGSFTAGANTRILISNNVTRAHGNPNSWDARFSLRKKRTFGYSAIYEMTQNNESWKSWSFTIDSYGTYDMYFQSYKVNGVTNSLDVNGMIE